MKTLIILFITIMLSACAGQTLLIPVKGKMADGTSYVRSSPVFRNTGQIKGPIAYSFDGLGVKVAFSSGDIDNATATAALHTGIQGDISQAGSLIFKTAATIGTASVLGSAADAASAFAR